MAFFSIVDLAGSAAQTTFTFTFPYLSRDHISVYIAGVVTTAFTFSSDYIIVLTTGLTVPATVRIQRLTPITTPVVDFVNGSVLGESDLDSAGLQLLYAMQETEDDQLNNLRLTANVLGQFDALGNRIVNVGAPTVSTDAATKTYVDGLVEGGASAAALASQNAAAASATSASTSATTATTQAGLATTAKTGAETARTGAETAKTGAETARTGAETARTGAEAARDAAQVAAGITGKVVRMVRTGNGTWAVWDADGVAVSIAASTTDGLQEAITTCSTQGASLWVYGGSVTAAGVDVATINCTTAITFPPMQGKTIRFDWCTVNFTAAVTGSGMTINSCMMVEFQFNGQVVYAGNAAAVSFRPTTVLPLDPVTSCVDSRFWITTIACIAGTNPFGASFDATTGAILGCTFGFQEVNGANGATVFGLHGLVVVSQAGNQGFIGNTVRCAHLHKWAGSSIQIGDSTVQATACHSNTFDVVAYPAGVNAVGVQVYGTHNRISCAILNNEGTVHTGIKLEATATKNIFTVLRNIATTALINDLSATKDNSGLAGSYAMRASVHRNAVDQTAVVTATFTKVLWTTEVFDHALAFDNGALSRWTPGRVGVARISAHVGWASILGAVGLYCAIFKNGTMHRYVKDQSAGTEGNQGPLVTALVSVDATTDYFEIFVRQDSGIARDIEGDADISWAMFEMLE